VTTNNFQPRAVGKNWTTNLVGSDTLYEKVKMKPTTALYNGHTFSDTRAENISKHPPKSPGSALS
jgi:hypothetical protein